MAQMQVQTTSGSFNVEGVTKVEGGIESGAVTLSDADGNLLAIVAFPQLVAIRRTAAN